MAVMTAGTRDAGPAGGRLGVCSWSLRPGSPAELAELVGATGLRAVQLALDPLRTGELGVAETTAALARAGVVVASGMMAMAGEDYSTLESIRRTGGVAPDATWEENLVAAAANARLAGSLGIGLVSFHAGFLPHDPADPRRAILRERVRRVAAAFEERGVEVALETGQESADTLLGLLPELGGRVGVNFDPANLVLYGVGEPVAALRLLLPCVRQVHVKDARPARRAGEWGTEVPVGEGAVDWPAFFAVLAGRRPGMDLMIERESGTERVADVRRARELVERLLPG